MMDPSKGFAAVGERRLRDERRRRARRRAAAVSDSSSGDERRSTTRAVATSGGARLEQRRGDEVGCVARAAARRRAAAWPSHSRRCTHNDPAWPGEAKAYARPGGAERTQDQAGANRQHVQCGANSTDASNTGASTTCGADNGVPEPATGLFSPSCEPLPPPCLRCAMDAIGDAGLLLAHPP